MFEGGMEEPHFRSKEEDLRNYSFSVAILTKDLKGGFYFNINYSSLVASKTAHYHLHWIYYHIIWLFNKEIDTYKFIHYAKISHNSYKQKIKELDRNIYTFISHYSDQLTVIAKS